MAWRLNRHRAWSLVSRLNRTAVRLFVVVEIAERLTGRRMLDKPRCAHLISLVDLKLAKWRKLPNPQIPRLVDNMQFHLALGVHAIVAAIHQVAIISPHSVPSLTSALPDTFPTPSRAPTGQHYERHCANDCNAIPRRT
jgi:hypothetical protein